jgi:hypothetical protein
VIASQVRQENRSRTVWMALSQEEQPGADEPRRLVAREKVRTRQKALSLLKFMAGLKYSSLQA